jgi:glycosyltransferase involved in cell wall biosynthesis
VTPRTRLGVYLDAPFARDPAVDDRVYANSQAFPFGTFLCEVSEQFGDLIFLGRRARPESRAVYPLPRPAHLIELPHYPDLGDLPAVARVTPATLRTLWSATRQVDVLLVFGPHPFALGLALVGLIRRKPVVLGVRQDTLRYYRARLRSKRRGASLLVMAALWLLDRSYRALARALPTIVVGGHVEHQYGGPRNKLEAVRISLVRREAVAHAPVEPASTRINLLTVGRIEPEKNPLLLVEALAELERRHPGRFHLRWLGRGRLESAVRDRIETYQLGHAVTLGGFVAMGPDLLDEYRQASLFIHVATTEALGQVLMEAMATGLPIVATDVGGVRWTVGDGTTAFLVPPNDRDALVDAIVQMSSDDALRRSFAEKGLLLARRHTLETEADRVATFLRSTINHRDGEAGH